jgi:hypothetical protein
MRIIGCDLHARQQTLAMLDSMRVATFGSFIPSVHGRLSHCSPTVSGGNKVREGRLFVLYWALTSLQLR